jgi:glycosyltransferase involved in cell wall biosynthesis
MFVTVVIPIYNGESDLPDLLACLRSQTYPPQQVEYLLVDNNSHDRTVEWVTQAIVDFEKAGLTLKLRSESQIQSSYAARNVGIKAANGDIIAFTDADCRPQPQWLEKLMEPFEKTDIDLVMGEIEGLPSQNWLEYYAEHNKVLSQHYTLENPFCPYGQTANLAARRSLFQTIGLFRPYLTTGGDADFCWRALKESHEKSEKRWYFAAQAIVFHRHRSTLIELAKQWQRYGRSNRYLHELHGIELMNPSKRSYLIYLWGRWLLREIPRYLLEIIRGKNAWLMILSTPINIYCNAQRFKGQSQAKLPDLARNIEYFS